MWIFSYPSILPYVLGAQKNRLIETVHSSLKYPQHMFWLTNKKINLLITHSYLEAYEFNLFLYLLQYSAHVNALERLRKCSGLYKFCCLHMSYQPFVFGETPKWVLLQTVKTQMKCSIMLHFIRVYTVCKGKKYLQTTRNKYFLIIYNPTSQDTMEYP